MDTIQMKYDLPAWAKQKMTPEDPRVEEARQLHRQGKMEIQFPDADELKAWAKKHQWPTPWFQFQDAFVAKLFESRDAFMLALTQSGITILVPITEHTITTESLEEFDEMYDARADMGALGLRPTRWESLVDELRKIRRLVEAGIRVKVAGTDTIVDTWQSFYAWAHGRYSMLEEGANSWIGDDKS